ncbi:MAG TPA: TolC family protein [Candidatus Baltobacteraceae bacterium]|jgi:outer membrane protein|nr:TolC family protein [Candidatus Baltobacteraceae bacterium]
MSTDFMNSRVSMFRFRSSRVGSCFFFALVLAAIALSAQPKPGAGAQIPAAMPTPYPLPTFAPASQPTALPYPAYGTPMPGVESHAEVAGVSHVLSLKDSVDVGLARSPQLQVALASVRVQDAAVGLSRTAIFPNIAGSASTSRQFFGGATSNNNNNTSNNNNNGNGSGNGRTNSTQTSNGASVNLTQLIFDGGKVVALLHEARANDKAAIGTARREAQTIGYGVATAYYASLQAQRQTQVALETLKLDQVQVDLVQAQFQAGTASKVDVATAKLPLAQARLSLVQAQGVEENAQTAFANAMGLPADTNVLPLDDTPVFDASVFGSLKIPTYAQALARAIAARPDYDASREQVFSSQAALRAAKLGTFPTLNGLGSYGLASMDSSGGNYGNTGSIGLSLSVPLYDQGITAAQRAQGQANLDSANAQLIGAQRTIELGVKQALISLVSAQAQLDQAQDQYDEASQVLQATEAQYRVGVTTLPLLLNAQVSFTSALTARVSAVYNLRQAQQAYLYQTGANL